MKKIIFSGFVIGCMLGASIFWDAGAVKAQTIELKFAHFMSPMHIQHQKSFVPFSERVEKLTGGKVKIKIYPGGALGAATQLPDGVKTGITDIAFIIPSYTTGRFPRSSAFDLPYLFDHGVQTTNVIYDVYEKYLADDYKDYRVLWLYGTGCGQLMSVTKPIRTMDDLKGKKMRSPTTAMTEALKLLGASPVGMPISELYMALEKKVIDGMLTPFSAVTDFKLFDLIKYITEVNMYTTFMAVVMNKEKFSSLPDFAKKAIDEASG
ncbi:MAG: TRAP transporter substrate-binding protein, partial [Pseudomonadota bacterium]